jgi:hypothetical protein
VVNDATPSTPPTDGSPLPLTITIVCRDNVDTLPRVLASIAGLAADTIAVDSGSTDGTLELLRAHGVTVIEQQWLGFVRQKQFALDRATQPWVLHLDSDESLTHELRASVRQAVSRDDPAVAAYAVNRRVWWGDHELKHAWQPEWRTRLVRNGTAAWGGYDPHDALEPTATGARVDRLAGHLRHNSITNFAEFMAKQARHAQTAALSYQRMGRRTSAARLVASPIGAWCKQMILRRAVLDGWRGIAAAGATAAAAFMKHATLLELQRQSSQTDDPTP